jgi:hypothetical protein
MHVVQQSLRDHDGDPRHLFTSVAVYMEQEGVGVLYEPMNQTS